MIEQVGLGSAARRRIKGYSLGMRQRLGIAAALLGDPRVLMFDEPVNGLDLDGVRWIRELLRRLADEGRTVLVSSHLMSEMQQTADRLVVIGRGRLIADATTEEILRGLGASRCACARRTPTMLAARLPDHGLASSALAPDELHVEGSTAEEVGELAHSLRHPAAPPLRGRAVPRGRLPRADREQCGVPRPRGDTKDDGAARDDPPTTGRASPHGRRRDRRGVRPHLRRRVDPAVDGPGQRGGSCWRRPS